MKTPSSNSRIIGAERLSGVRRFTLVDLDDGLEDVAPTRAAPDRVDEIHQRSFDAGLQEGLRRSLELAREHAAREAAQRQAQAVDAFAERITALTEAIEAQIAAAPHMLAEQVVELAAEIAGRTVVGTLRLQPERIVDVVREAITAMLDERAAFALHLHPSDVGLVEAALEPLLRSRGARCVADASIEPGGCRLSCASAEIDATLATRWKRVFAAMGFDAPPALPVEPA